MEVLVRHLDEAADLAAIRFQRLVWRTPQIHAGYAALGALALYGLSRLSDRIYTAFDSFSGLALAIGV